MGTLRLECNRVKKIFKRLTGYLTLGLRAASYFAWSIPQPSFFGTGFLSVAWLRGVVLFLGIYVTAFQCINVSGFANVVDDGTESEDVAECNRDG